MSHHDLDEDPHHARDHMLNIEEASEFLRVPVNTLRDWRLKGTGPHSFRVGKRVWYWHSELVTWRYDQSQPASRR